jgi:predicted DNA-binding transcriptional regulator YafY
LQDAPSSDALVFGVPPPPDPSGWRNRLESAVLRHRRVRLFYLDAGRAVSQRRDFRVFRLDRMIAVTVLRGVFPEEPGRTLIDDLERV